jgi:hypothetical protein
LAPYETGSHVRPSPARVDKRRFLSLDRATPLPGPVGQTTSNSARPVLHPSRASATPTKPEGHERIDSPKGTSQATHAPEGTRGRSRPRHGSTRHGRRAADAPMTSHRPSDSGHRPADDQRYRSFVTSIARPSKLWHARRRSREEWRRVVTARVRAPTISYLPWGFGPFDACRSEQRPTPGFHTRLCSAFRFSQPLDALLRSRPFRPCFMPVTPLGFRFRRVPLPGSQRHLSVPPVLRAVYETTSKVRPGRLIRHTTTRI